MTPLSQKGWDQAWRDNKVHVDTALVAVRYNVHRQSRAAVTVRWQTGSKGGRVAAWYRKLMLTQGNYSGTVTRVHCGHTPVLVGGHTTPDTRLLHHVRFVVKLPTLRHAFNIFRQCPGYSLCGKKQNPSYSINVKREWSSGKHVSCYEFNTAKQSTWRLPFPFRYGKV